MAGNTRLLLAAGLGALACAVAGCGSSSGGQSAPPKSGTYKGTTSQGKPVELVVAKGGTALSYLAIEGRWKCSNGETAQDTVPRVPSGSVPLKNEHFAGAFRVQGYTTTTYGITGSYREGAFSGTLRITATPEIGTGTCASGNVTWHTSRSSPSTARPKT